MRLVIKGNRLRYVCIFILKGLWYLISAPFSLIAWLARKPKRIKETTQQEIYEEVLRLSESDCPEFQQYIPLTDVMGIGIEFIEFCPDEKVVLRVVGETSFSKQYRRQVYTVRKSGDLVKYFKLNNKVYYLKPKVKPLDPIQAKK